MNMGFTQKQIELDVANILKNGDITQLHLKTGVGYSQLDQQLNPNETRKSPVFQFLVLQTAYDAISPERGEQLWQVVTKYRELEKPVVGEICVQTEASCIAKEVGELLSVHIAGKSHYERLNEVNDVLAVTERYKQGILDEINLEKASENGTNLRYATNSSRLHGKEAVAQRGK